MNKEQGTTPSLRVYGHPYRGSLVFFGETVLELMPEAKLGRPRHASKLASRWTLGLWVGKTEESDEHLLSVDNVIGRYRSVRRLAVEDAKKWNVTTTRRLKVALGHSRSSSCPRGTDVDQTLTGAAYPARGSGARVLRHGRLCGLHAERPVLSRLSSFDGVPRKEA